MAHKGPGIDMKSKDTPKTEVKKFGLNKIKDGMILGHLFWHSGKE